VRREMPAADTDPGEAKGSQRAVRQMKFGLRHYRMPEFLFTCRLADGLARVRENIPGSLGFT
jgi:hypothetical protein